MNILVNFLKYLSSVSSIYYICHWKGCLPPCMYILNVHAPIMHIIMTINDNFMPSLLKVSLKYHNSHCLLLLAT